MEHKGTVSLETERLILRPFTMEDVAPAFRNWVTSEKVTEFLRWPPHKDISVTTRVLRDWVEGYSDPAFYQWAIEVKELHEPIGSISVVGMDERTEKVHVGYCIGERWWHQGYTSEAYAAVIRFLFEEVKVRRIESQHDTNNPNSGRVMEKCGMTCEGVLRKADWSNKGIVDACMHSLLAEEFYQNDQK